MDTTTIHILDNGKRITAVHIPNPEYAKNPRAVLNEGASDDYMVIALADRHYKSHGDEVSGWVFSCPFFVESRDIVSTKRQAKARMRYLIGKYFSTPGKVRAVH